jgi:hypothetical protein
MDFHKENKKMFLKHEIRNLSIQDQISFYKMAIKYWWSGDDWLFAQEYALSMIKGWKR